MAVEIKYTLKLRSIGERIKRSTWLNERIPTKEFHIDIEECPNDDGWDIDDDIENIVTVWSSDAELVATEFWFKFP
jgi:hypothetical protein